MRRAHVVWLVPILLLAACWLTRPFAGELSAVTLSMASLSATQRHNVAVAARVLNNTVLLPGETFSFNRVVGPRTAARGYKTAPAYLESETAPSLGGGICLVSSAVYQAALSAGLPIVERVRHLRTVRSVPPGLDATVWYGQADLRFINHTGRPLRIQADMASNHLTIRLQGVRREVSKVYRQERRVNGRQVSVSVWRDGVLISRDLYRLP